jgi:hypothetical protein
MICGWEQVEERDTVEEWEIKPRSRTLPGQA